MNLKIGQEYIGFCRGQISAGKYLGRFDGWHYFGKPTYAFGTSALSEKGVFAHEQYDQWVLIEFNPTPTTLNSDVENLVIQHLQKRGN